MTLYMVIETFYEGCLPKAYERLATKGRMLPEGLLYVDSWLSEDGERCFQLMQTDDRALFDIWVKNWEDLVSFEIIRLGEKPG